MPRKPLTTPQFIQIKENKASLRKRHFPIQRPDMEFFTASSGTACDNSWQRGFGESSAPRSACWCNNGSPAPGASRGAFEEHNEIYLAIRNREPARATSRMRTHLHKCQDSLGKRPLSKTPAVVP